MAVTKNEFTFKTTHFGKFTEEQCKEAIQYCINLKQS